MHLRDMRTLNELRAEAPSDDAIRRMPDRLLRAATQNPDHSEAARNAAGAELRARSINVDRWRLGVPGFISPADLERHGDRLFFGWGRALRLWSGRGVFLGFLAILALAFARELTGVPANAEEIGMYVGAAVLWSMVIWFVASALRRHPARMLLLRKFNERHLSETLERMLAQELRPYGHIATLSDKYIRRERFGWLQMALLSLGNPLAALWFVIGLPIRFIWRLFDRSAMGPAVVLNARDYRNLA